MKRLTTIYESIYYSLPIQLVIIQIRYQKFLLVIWLFLFMIITNNFGEAFGIPYLLLEPEYMGEVNFYSNFLLGIGMGVFITVYMVTSYITNSYRYPFLSLEYRPFFVYFYNNSLIPVFFLVLYGFRFIKLKIFLHGEFDWWMAGELAAVLLGVAMTSIFILLYFFRSNRNFVENVAGKVVKELKGRRVILEKARMGMGLRIRVDNYLVGLFKVRQPDRNLPADFRKLVEKLLNRNHGNALFLQLILLVVIIALDFLDHIPYFLFPAGTSILLMLSVILMLFAAFIFWFRRMGPAALLVLVGVYFLLNATALDRYRHPAVGMNYEAEPTPYTPEHLYTVHSEENIKRDVQNTVRTLDLWLSDYQVFNGAHARPRPVIICTSGGGLRSAYFTMRVMQKLDSLSDGRFMDRTRLLTGASGGMVGAAYYRELYLRSKLGEDVDPRELVYAQRVGQDLLNRVSLKIVTGMFLPTKRKKLGDTYYRSDRGWSFDDQLATNLGVWRDKRLGDYTDHEELALIPQMILSPVIINDGRKLYISSMPVTYLSRTPSIDGGAEEAITGIDFGRFFQDQASAKLRFSTALRMNASFPFITPYVRLPSEPPIEVIDAGVADNYGVETADAYLDYMAPWYLKKVDTLLLVQIRDSKVETNEVPEYTPENSLRQLLDPIGATYGALRNSSEFVSQRSLVNMEHTMEGKMAYACFQYAPADTGGIKASLSWHLTLKEIEGIEEALANENNQAVFKMVADFMNREGIR